MRPWTRIAILNVCIIVSLLVAYIRFHQDLITLLAVAGISLVVLNGVAVALIGFRSYKPSSGMMSRSQRQWVWAFIVLLWLFVIAEYSKCRH